MLIFPIFITPSLNKHCDIIVGITALNDCLGPKVLNGLKIVTGKLNDL